MNAPRKTSPAPVVSTALTSNAGDVVQTVAFEGEGAARAKRDAQQPVMLTPDLPQRTLHVRLAGQRRRDVLGKNRQGHERYELLGSLRDPIDVARDVLAALAPGTRHHDRGVLIDVVDVQHTGRAEDLERQLAAAQRKRLVAIPEHDALPRVLADHDHRELIGKIANHRVGHVDAAPRELVADATPVVVRAGNPDILRREPHRDRRSTGPSPPGRRSRASGC